MAAKAESGLTHSLADETVESKPADKVQVELLTPGEELSAHVEMRVDATSGIEEVLSDVNGSRMGVIKAESVEHLGELLDV